MAGTSAASQRPWSGRKVLVAMSGGVDSSVAAAELKEQGAEVVGCFMRLGSPGETLDELSPDTHDTSGPAGSSCDPARIRIGHQGCCSINDAADARHVAALLDIPLYICNFKKDFGRIIDYFVDEYAEGRTPNPCVRCNDWLKFGKLHAYARQIGAEFVASGHYARVDRSGPRAVLRRGLGTGKDQSYVLFGAPRDRLDEMILPIGEHPSKEAVRDLARRHGLPVSDKPDSQEICFVPDNDYAGLVERRRPELVGSGRIVDRNGAELGTHAGQHRFTIGQRRGVGVAFGRPIYVVEKRPETNEVVVGAGDELRASSCVVREPNWLIDPPPIGAWFEARAQHRSHGEPAPARVRVLDPRSVPDTDPCGPSGRIGAFEVVFDRPERAVTPGQAIVLYSVDDPSLVLGGGWIARVG